LPRLALAVTALLAATPLLHGQIVPATGYQIDTSFTAVADPPVPRPSTQPCVVNLVTEVESSGSPVPFNYTPPANCPGPYSKIVLVGDFTVTGGIQFDRTSQLFLNGVDIFFGTTPEPTDPVLSDPWHIERDVTDYAALFAQPGTGLSELINYTSSEYNSVQYSTVNLYFYPVNQNNPKSQPPADVVIPLMTAQGGTASLNQTTPEVDTTVSLPTNLKQLYMDIFAESQNAEEQWFTCTADDVVYYVSYDGCPNTAFREVEVSIDGVPAGVAPVSPWIYTGGIDPYLWFPIPGNQTLNFKPYRVDLSPFAGLVSDGQQHTFGVSVFNVYEYFNVAATLLGYEDSGSTHTSGSIVYNTLTAPNPDLVEDISQDPNTGIVSGTVTVTSNRGYAISGTVNTSNGTITNQVSADIAFSNVSNGSGDGESFVIQDLVQNSSVATTSVHGAETSSSYWTFPIVLDAEFTINSDGGYYSATSVQQNWSLTNDPFSVGSGEFPPPVAPAIDSYATNTVNSSDNYLVVACPEGYCLSYEPESLSNQLYQESDSNGYCYYQGIDSELNVLTNDFSNGYCSSEYSGSAVGRIHPFTPRTGVGKPAKHSIPGLRAFRPSPAIQRLIDKGIERKEHPVEPIAKKKEPITLTR
jgi:hypothetical protein